MLSLPCEPDGSPSSASRAAPAPARHAYAELPWPDDPVVGAERVHRILCGWLVSLGHPAYSSSVSPGESTRTSTSGASSPA